MNSQTFQLLPKPVPQYAIVPNPSSLLECVTLELEHERQQNIMLIRELTLERKRIQELEIRIFQGAQTGSFLPPSFRCVESSSSQASTEGTKSGLTSRVQSTESLLTLSEPKREEMVGRYPQSIRMQKIAKYKAKIQTRRHQAKMNRSYKGRSRVATEKPRVKGRFVKTDKSEC